MIRLPIGYTSAVSCQRRGDRLDRLTRGETRSCDSRLLFLRKLRKRVEL
jgi:hypothetical protein